MSTRDGRSGCVTTPSCLAGLDDPDDPVEHGVWMLAQPTQCLSPDSLLSRASGSADGLQASCRVGLARSCEVTAINTTSGLSAL